jgi:hypothetical protein
VLEVQVDELRVAGRPGDHGLQVVAARIEFLGHTVRGPGVGGLEVDGTGHAVIDQGRPNSALDHAGDLGSSLDRGPQGRLVGGQGDLDLFVSDHIPGHADRTDPLGRDGCLKRFLHFSSGHLLVPRLEARDSRSAPRSRADSASSPLISTSVVLRSCVVAAPSIAYISVSRSRQSVIC